MKPLRLIVALAGLLALAPSCAHTPNANNVLSAVIDCAVPKIHDLAISLVPTVETIVAQRGEGWEAELMDLGRTTLEDVVACAIRQVQAVAFRASAASPSDTLSSVKAARAQSYAHTRGYRFAGGS